jgi:hypothetical protein
MRDDWDCESQFAAAIVRFVEGKWKGLQWPAKQNVSRSVIETNDLRPRMI